MTDDLITFLLARLNEDASAASEAAHDLAGHWTTEGSYAVSVADKLPQGAEVWDKAVAFAEGAPSPEQATHIARHDPAHVLAEADAKREITDLHRPEITDYVDGAGIESASVDCLTCDTRGSSNTWPCKTVRLLALPYADHPDYRDEWRS